MENNLVIQLEAQGVKERTDSSWPQKKSKPLKEVFK